MLCSVLSRGDFDSSFHNEINLTKRSSLEQSFRRAGAPASPWSQILITRALRTGRITRADSENGTFGIVKMVLSIGPTLWSEFWTLAQDESRRTSGSREP